MDNLEPRLKIIIKDLGFNWEVWEVEESGFLLVQ